MIVIDQTLIGRQYHTHTTTTRYTVRGVYVLPEQKPIILGEYPDPQAKVNRLTTHRIEDCKFDLDPAAAPAT
jgi:hypothetical protein